MKTTKKQYEVCVMYKKFDHGKWKNAMAYDVNGGKKYADTLEEAKRAIENVKKMWENDRNRKTPKVTQRGMVGVSVEPVRDDTFEVVKSRIRVREITEWEEIK